MKKWLKYMLFSTMTFILLSGFSVPDHPINSVYDETGLISQEVIEKLNDYNEQLAQIEQQPQIALLVIDSLNGETIETVANQTIRRWKVGFSTTNNGILVALAIKDRKMRIETSDEIAGVLTDYEANRILDVAKQDFRKQDYSAGVDKLLDELVGKLSNKMDIALNTPTQTDQQVYQSSRYASTNNLFDLVHVLIGGIILMFIFIPSRKRKYYRTSSKGQDMLMGMLLGSLFNQRASRKHRRYWDDDDDEHHFFGGFGSGHSNSSGSGSSGNWSGGGFSGGGSSGSW